MASHPPVRCKPRTPLRSAVLRRLAECQDAACEVVDAQSIRDKTQDGGALRCVGRPESFVDTGSLCGAFRGFLLFFLSLLCSFLLFRCLELIQFALAGFDVRGHGQETVQPFWMERCGRVA
jgi:hypothetical protein